MKISKATSVKASKVCLLALYTAGLLQATVALSFGRYHAAHRHVAASEEHHVAPHHESAPFAPFRRIHDLYVMWLGADTEEFKVVEIDYEVPTHEKSDPELPKVHHFRKRDGDDDDGDSDFDLDPTAAIEKRQFRKPPGGFPGGSPPGGVFSAGAFSSGSMPSGLPQSFTANHSFDHKNKNNNSNFSGMRSGGHSATAVSADPTGDSSDQTTAAATGGATSATGSAAASATASGSTDQQRR